MQAGYASVLRYRAVVSAYDNRRFVFKQPVIDICARQTASMGQMHADVFVERLETVTGHPIFENVRCGCGPSALTPNVALPAKGEFTLVAPE